MTTILSLFLARLAEQGDHPALRVKRAGEYVSLSWNEMARDAHRAAAAMRRLGVQPGDRVIQVAENRYEWIIGDLAIFLARAVHVPVHSTLAGGQIAYQIRDCQPSLVLLSGPSQAEKLQGEQLPETPVLAYDACSQRLNGRPILHFAEAVAESADDGAAEMQREAAENVKPDDLATILYTSGTTGEPKGVMLTHDNLASNALGTLSVFAQEPDDVRLTWLPLSHIFARTCDLYTWYATPGMELALAESRDTILGDCGEVKPTLMNGVPYFFDKIFRFLSDNGQGDSPDAAKQLLGGRVRMCCSGGAALPDHVAQFFNRQGVRLEQGYGLTETSPVITVCTDPAKLGSVGAAIPGVEVRISDDGEILTRGPHVMRGYWNKPEATAEVLKDGWLYTGDLGRLDNDGFLYITGRKKELIVTASGKNIAPVALEALLSQDPLIHQALVVGDGRNYLTALIVPDENNLSEELASREIEPQADRNADPRVREIFAQRLRQRLAAVSSHEQIGGFTLIADPFTPERGELTPTLKLRRGVIHERYADVIEAMYRPRA